MASSIIANFIPMLFDFMIHKQDHPLQDASNIQSAEIGLGHFPYLRASNFE
jgi:hypothetical protein